MSLLVDQVYGHATVQGAPRFGLRAFGVPPGGAWDSVVQRSLNVALGNLPNSAVLELALCRLTLLAQEELNLAWDGVPVDTTLNGVSSCDGFASLRSGDLLEFQVPKVGARVWIAVNGGFISVGEAALRRGEVLDRGSTSGQGAGYGQIARTEDTSVLRVIPGREEFSRLFENVYHVRHDSNRVGIRLDGPKMAHQLELPSEPATAGVIQITPEGLPIILGPDGPTIGGYPRGGVVVTADVPKMAQLRPGDSVRFSAMSLSNAQSIIR